MKTVANLVLLINGIRALFVRLVRCDNSTGRYIPSNRKFETPGGYLENQLPEYAANREFFEETGGDEFIQDIRKRANYVGKTDVVNDEGTVLIHYYVYHVFVSDYEISQIESVNPFKKNGNMETDMIRVLDLSKELNASDPNKMNISFTTIKSLRRCFERITSTKGTNNALNKLKEMIGISELETDDSKNSLLVSNLSRGSNSSQFYDSSRSSNPSQGFNLSPGSNSSQGFNSSQRFNSSQDFNPKPAYESKVEKYNVRILYLSGWTDIREIEIKDKHWYHNGIRKGFIMIDRRKNIENFKCGDRYDSSVLVTSYVDPFDCQIKDFDYDKGHFTVSREGPGSNDWDLDHVYTMVIV